MFQLCRCRNIGNKKLPCGFNTRSQGGFYEVGGVIVHLTNKRASEGNALSEYFCEKTTKKIILCVLTLINKKNLVD